MNAKAEDGGPAFPLFTPDGHFNGSISEAGMTLRDYFVAKVMQGLLASEEADRTWPKDANSGEGYEQWIGRIAFDRARFCYTQADAMLKARQA